MLGVNDLSVKTTERAAPLMDVRCAAMRPHVVPLGTRCLGAPMTAISTIDGNYYPGMHGEHSITPGAPIISYMIFRVCLLGGAVGW